MCIYVHAHNRACSGRGCCLYGFTKDDFIDGLAPPCRAATFLDLAADFDISMLTLKSPTTEPSGKSGRGSAHSHLKPDERHTVMLLTADPLVTSRLGALPGELAIRNAAERVERLGSGQFATRD